MPIQACPVCAQQTPHLLEATSKTAHVNYYTCPDCQHIWTIDKQNPSVVTHVTPFPTKPPSITPEA